MSSLITIIVFIRENTRGNKFYETDNAALDPTYSD